MATLIGLGLLLWLVHLAYRDGRRALGRTRPANPVLRRLDAEMDTNRLDLDRLDLDRLRRDIGVACAAGTPEDDPAVDPPEGADTVAEERETTLTHQLLAGAMEPPTYQRLMSELAHTDAKSGGAR